MLKYIVSYLIVNGFLVSITFAQDIVFNFEDTKLPPQFAYTDSFTLNQSPLSVTSFDSNKVLLIEVGKSLTFSSTNFQTVTFQRKNKEEVGNSFLITEYSCNNEQYIMIDSTKTLPTFQFFPDAVSESFLGSCNLRWRVSRNSDSGLYIDEISVYYLTPDQIQLLDTQKRLQDLSTRLNHVIKQSERRDSDYLASLIDSTEKHYSNYLESSIQISQKYKQIYFAGNLGNTISSLNSAVNPSNYTEFKTLLSDAKNLSDQVNTLHLDNLVNALSKPSNKIQRLLDSGKKVVETALGNTTFGIISSSLKSIFASTYSRYNQQSNLNSPIQCALEDASKIFIRHKNLQASINNCIEKNNTELSKKISQGKDAYLKTSEFLDIMFEQNRYVNNLNDQLLVITNNAFINSELSKTNLRSLLEYINHSTNDLNTFTAAMADINNKERNRLEHNTESFFSNLKTSLHSDNSPENLNRISRKLASLNYIFDQINQTDIPRYNNLIDDFDNYFRNLVVYSSQENPFLESTYFKTNEPCLPQNQNSYCVWESSIDKIESTLNNIYPSEFDLQFKKASPIKYSF